jgi:hypothetical protein
MNRQTSEPGKPNTDQDKKQGVLEKVAQLIDPPSREVSDAELIDPGSSIPAEQQNREQKAPDRK